MTRRLRSSLVLAGAIVLAFLAFSILWIVLTDRILGWVVRDPDLLLRLATYKGLLYTVITSGLLFWLVFSALELRGVSLAKRWMGPLRGLRIWLPALLFLGSMLLMCGLAYFSYLTQADYFRRDGNQRMAYLADKKAGRIDTWVRERFGDARVMAADPLLLEQLRGLGAGARPGPALRRKLERRLEVVCQAYLYRSVRLLAPDGSLIAGSDSRPLPAWEALAATRVGAADPPRMLWEVRQDPVQGPRLAMACVAPVALGRATGTLVFQVDPGMPLGDGSVGGWPTDSPSGETLLLARRGDEAVYLNRTRRAGAPMLHMPMSRRDLVGIQALQSANGVKLGVDYQGVPSVAASHWLKELPWVLIVKLDRNEYLMPVRRLALTYAGLGGLFLVLTAAFMVAWFLRERARLEAEGRAASRQLELLSRYGNDIVLVMDAEGRLVEANDRALAAYQFRREEIHGLRVQDLRAGGGRADFPRQFQEVKEKSQIRFKTLHLRRDGSTFPVEVSSMAFELDGQVLVQSIVRDITEQEAYEARIQALNSELEQRVQERTAQLETAFREMEAFSYSVSHDLRAPLRGIDGFGHALAEEYGQRLDDQGRHYLKRIRGAAQRMGQIMDDLLDLARLSRHDLVLTGVDLSAQAREILEALVQGEPGRQVTVTIQDGLLAQADPRLIYMVLLQLLSNAWKFTARTAATRIEVGSTEAHGTTAFFVRDNGVGFDMAYAGKLFDAFQRLHAPDQFPGTGVGLTIAQRILLRHGGRIWAEAAEHQGATFFFSLP